MTVEKFEKMNTNQQIDFLIDAAESLRGIHPQLDKKYAQGQIIYIDNAGFRKRTEELQADFIGTFVKSNGVKKDGPYIEVLLGGNHRHSYEGKVIVHKHPAQIGLRELREDPLILTKDILEIDEAYKLPIGKIFPWAEITVGYDDVNKLLENFGSSIDEIY